MVEPAEPLTLLLRRLRAICPLSDDDAAAVLALPGIVRNVEPSSYLIREGEKPQHCGVLLSGFAFRQKLSHDGARQIVGVLVPGEALDFQTLFLDVADHNVQALTRCEILSVPVRALHELFHDKAAVARAITANMLVEASVTREWLLNVGRRDARTRLAHLLCEFATRMEAQGLGGAHGYDLPMTQEQLGDALGLTSVHINRTLRTLEQEQVLAREGRRIRIRDWPQMRRIADFSGLYLHLGQAGHG